MSLESAVEIAVLVLVAGAAWLSLRKPSELDWERLWKTALATVHRGEIEANGGGQDAWWARLEAVPFHPQGRHAAAKLNAPNPQAISIPALDGERALVERLAGLGTIEERWKRMFREESAAQDALMSDPSELGAAYDPSRVLAPGLGWERVAVWDADVQTAIARRAQDTVLAVIGRSSEPFSAAVPHAAAVQSETASEDELLALVPEAHQRLAVIAEGDAVAELLRTLHGSPALRDRVRMVVSIGATMDAEWMAEHFGHLAFDTELNRQTPYAAITDVVDPAATIPDQRFPVPEVPPSGWAPIASMDLGVLPVSQNDPKLIARALWVVLCFSLSRH